MPMPGPVYSSLDVRDLTGVTLRQLQWWDEQGVVTPMQKGHRRLYTVPEVLRVSLIMGLRRKSMSLQKIRLVLSKLGTDAGARLLRLDQAGRDVFLLTDGENVYVENSLARIVGVLKDAMHPLTTLCVSDLIRQLQPAPGQRKSVHAATSAAGRSRVSKAS